MRKTKIVCTLGPSSNDPKTIEALIRAGMNAARLNFSHGDHESHRLVFRTVRELSAALRTPVSILQDLQGPKIRVGKLVGDALQLIEGQEVVIACNHGTAAAGEIPCTYGALATDLNPGDTILLDDGRLKLKVLGNDGAARLRCEIVVGGELTNNKGINLPGAKLSTPAVTEKDRRDLALGRELGVDYIALSFVRCADDLRVAHELAGDIPLIAKLEKPEAIENFDEILTQCEGIMVARGDLGVEVGPERVPLLQKEFIEKGNAQGKLVITATEMLESMRHSPRPTRAEVSDVANAVLDGTDAVMLSGETASGDYPVASVRTMAQVLVETESSARYRQQPQPGSLALRDTTAAIARAAVIAANEIDAVAILCYMDRDAIAMIASEYRPAVPLVAVTHNESMYHRLALHWGVVPLYLAQIPSSSEDAMRVITERAKDAALIRPGDPIVIVAGSRMEGPSDLLKVLRA